jgi:AraC-like DNA-binding protein
MGTGAAPGLADPVTAAVGRFTALHGMAADRVDDAWQALGDAGVELPGLAFAAWVETAALGGLLTPIVANCPDVATALTELERFHPLVERDRVVLMRGPRSATIGLRSADGGHAHPDTVDAFFAIVSRMLRHLAGEHARPSMVTLLRAVPPSGRGAHEAAFGVPAAFGRAVNSCRFDSHALRERIGQADPAIRQALLPYAETRVARRRAPWSATVRELAAGSLPGLAEVARALAVSPRTLQARLEEEGTTFAAVVDGVRKERALALLGEHDLPISVIAVRTGFATPSAFTRAFRRWTGLAPSDFRRHAARPDGARPGGMSR